MVLFMKNKIFLFVLFFLGAFLLVFIFLFGGAQLGQFSVSSGQERIVDLSKHFKVHIFTLQGTNTNICFSAGNKRDLINAVFLIEGENINITGSEFNDSIFDSEVHLSFVSGEDINKFKDSLIIKWNRLFDNVEVNKKIYDRKKGQIIVLIRKADGQILSAQIPVKGSLNADQIGSLIKQSPIFDGLLKKYRD